MPEHEIQLLAVGQSGINSCHGFRRHAQKLEALHQRHNLSLCRLVSSSFVTPHSRRKWWSIRKMAKTLALGATMKKGTPHDRSLGRMPGFLPFRHLQRYLLFPKAWAPRGVRC